MKKDKVRVKREKYENIKWERDYYKARFENYNKCFNRLTEELLGDDYYNFGCDAYICDAMIVDDIIYLYKPFKRKWWQFWKRKLF